MLPIRRIPSGTPTPAPILMPVGLDGDGVVDVRSCGRSAEADADKLVVTLLEAMLVDSIDIEGATDGKTVWTGWMVLPIVADPKGNSGPASQTWASDCSGGRQAHWLFAHGITRAPASGFTVDEIY